jgi:hypothetical protein
MDRVPAPADQIVVPVTCPIGVTGLCVGTPARHGRALPQHATGKSGSCVTQTRLEAAIFLGFDCPARGLRVEGGPAGRRTRSATPTLDPVTTHLVFAPMGKMGEDQDRHLARSMGW